MDHAFDDPEYWEAVFEHVLAVLRRHDTAASSPGDPEEVAHLQAREERLLDVVRRRVEATRAARRSLAIDAVRERFDLDAFEATVVKILVVFTVTSVVGVNPIAVPSATSCSWIAFVLPLTISELRWTGSARAAQRCGV